MIRTRKPKRANLFTCAALGLALPLGLAVGTAPAYAQKAPKITFSPGFTKAAAEFDKTLSEANSNATVKAAADRARAANDPQAKAAAAAEVDAALGGARAKLAAISPTATSSGDKLKFGEMTRTVGVLMGDPGMQHQGLVQMINSGAAAPEQMGQLQFLAGVTAYQGRDYQAAVSYLRPSYDSGYRDQDGLIQRVLADAYKRTNNPAAAAQLAQADIQAAKAGGGKPAEDSIRSALQAAYDAKQSAQAFSLAADLVQYYPSAQSWNASLLIVSSLAGLQSQDNLDLMRLMSRTGAMTERGHFLEYIQNADPRRLPAETLKVIDAGVASGKLPASDSYVAEARQTANARLAADRASLPALERDARAGSASAVTVSAAGDAFLSYEQPAKAEELYKIALTKSGVDKNRVLTRLGIAQIDQNKVAEAQQSFAQVQGPRQPMAKLWSIYAANKAGGGAATASAR